MMNSPFVDFAIRTLERFVMSGAHEVPADAA
jgi:hypothetical protein